MRLILYEAGGILIKCSARDAESNKNLEK